MALKKVLIIGAGIAGLSAGSYLQRNGYDTEIFEAHSIPGGLCTAWKRGDYTIDYCVHWLMGTKPNTGFDVVWNELGAFENEDGSRSEIVNLDDFSRMEFVDGSVVRLFSDADRLKEELLRIAPEDRKMIVQLAKDLKRLSRFRITTDPENHSPIHRASSLLGNLSIMPRFLRHARTPMKVYADQFRNPIMKKVLMGVIPPDWSVMSLTMGLSMQHRQAAGYPVGGSLAFARNIERKYRSLGGQVHYRNPVDKIIVKKGKAVGIRLSSGVELTGDEVVSAADGHTTLFEMLEGNYLTDNIRKAYETFPLFPSSVLFGFGIARDMSSEPHSLILELDKPLEFPDGSVHNSLAITFRHYDPTLAPKGKTSAKVIFNTWRDQYWRDLALSDRKSYEQVKEELKTQVVELMEKRFPGIGSDIEVSDVSTPHTVQRYTRNWHGSYEGFGPTPQSVMARLPNTLPSLQNFSMIGQWTNPGGGLPPAGLDGRNLARRFCRQDGVPFSGTASHL